MCLTYVVIFYVNILIEKPTGPQLANKFTTLQGNREPITIQPLPPYPEPDESSTRPVILSLYDQFQYYPTVHD